MWFLLIKQLQVTAFAHEERKQIISGAGHKVAETEQRLDPSIVTERKKAHKSYSEAVATNIPQQPHITPVSKIKHCKK